MHQLPSIPRQTPALPRWYRTNWIEFVFSKEIFEIYTQFYIPPLSLRLIKIFVVSILSLIFVSSGQQPVLAQSCQLYASPHQRFGVNVTRDGGVSIDDYDVRSLNAGWYHDYGQRLVPSHPSGMQYYQMIRSNITNFDTQIGPMVDANPGAVWLIGNEPDVWGQDGLTPVQYAVFYHNAYTFLKQRDPSSHVSAGGIVEPSVLRLRYLNMVLAEYQQRYGTPLPTDSWQIHVIILPENCDTWGAHLPPGLNAYASEGLPCASHDDHGNIEIFKKMVVDFRQWMKDHNYRNLPLIISEYGIMYSPYHGYSNERVRDYMYATFDYLLNTTNSSLGYPADSNRLVQEWSWFSLNYYEFDPITWNGLNGNLFDHDTRAMEFLGHAYMDYTKQRMLKNIDLMVTKLNITPEQPQQSQPLTLHAEFVNQGSIAAQDVVVRFWNGDPRTNGQLLGATVALPQVFPGCGDHTIGELVWTPAGGGDYTIFAELAAANAELESELTNNYLQQTINVPGAVATATPTATATATSQFTPTPMPVDTTNTPTPSATPTLVAGGDASVVVQPNQRGQIDYVSSQGLQIKVIIPAAAVDQSTLFVFTELDTPRSSPPDLAFAGYAFALNAYQNGLLIENFVFQNPITIVVTYPAHIVTGVSEEQILLYAFAPSQNRWSTDGITLLVRDAANRQLTVLAAHLTEFGLFAPSLTTPTPTATPTQLATPTPSLTPTPTATQAGPATMERRIYLPFAQR